MTTSTHCSLRTFWIGYCDWFNTRVSMTHAEALREARDDLGSSLSKKALRTTFTIVAVIGLLGFVAAIATPALVKGAVSAGATSEQVALAAQWGTILTLGSIAGYFVVSKAVRIRRFCLEMCARGREIEVLRAQKQQ